MTTAAKSVSANDASARLAFQLYVAIGIAVFLLMMIAGAALRAAQAAWLPIPANFGYRFYANHLDSFYTCDWQLAPRA